jgi:hypothetical protein
VRRTDGLHLLNLPAFLLAALTLVSRPQAPVLVHSSLAVHDLATLTDRQARQLAGQRTLFRVHLDGNPDGSAEAGWTFDCRGDGAPLGRLWLPDDDDLVAHATWRGSGTWRVLAMLRRIVHPPIVGAGGSRRPGLVEYRLTKGRVVDLEE